jgi:hypothetical protein
MIKAIALYLPQFHPIPENDEWWGKGFTEWTNVTKAKPLFKGHWQPRLPADLGFYDLRVAEVREAQSLLAKRYGIHGFCYWHYWFAGKRVIERPFEEMVKSGKPDFPFCIAWANQTWSGTWHGLSNKKILIEQTYPGVEDYKAHFFAMLPAFQDKRYIQVDGKKLVFVFRPMEIPDPKQFTDCWRELAVKEGLGGLHFVGMHMPVEWDFAEYGFDAIVEEYPDLSKLWVPGIFDKIAHRIFKADLQKIKKNKFNLPIVVPYKNYVDNYLEQQSQSHVYPMIYPGWDNTPRSGSNGWLFEGATPQLFEKLCSKAFAETENKPPEEKIVIIKSWNEWAEGNYMEPDREFGHQYLEAFERMKNEYSVKNQAS